MVCAVFRPVRSNQRGERGQAMARSNSRPKIEPQDQDLPLIDIGKRVIHFRGDHELFKIVAKSIMQRVDLDPGDLDALLGQSGNSPAPDWVDLDAIINPGAGNAPAAQPAQPGGTPDAERPLSERFRLWWNRDYSY